MIRLSIIPASAAEQDKQMNYFSNGFLFDSSGDGDGGGDITTTELRLELSYNPWRSFSV